MKKKDEIEEWYNIYVETSITWYLQVEIKVD